MPSIIIDSFDLYSTPEFRRLDREGLALALVGTGPSRSEGTTETDVVVDSDRVKQAFQAVRDEFQKAVEPTRRWINMLNAVVFIALIGAVVAAVFLPLFPVVSTAAITGALVGARYAEKLHLRTMKFLLGPATYEVAFNLCTSSQQRQELLRSFVQTYSPNVESGDFDKPSAGSQNVPTN